MSSPSRVSRLLAAVSYLLGAFALIVVAIGPKNPFLLRHAQQAMVLHIVRLMLSSVAMLTWYVSTESGGLVSASVFTLHFAMLVLLGVPWPSEIPTEFLLLLGLPLGGPWVLAMIAAMISALGLSLDLRAAMSSRWPDWLDDSIPEIGTPEFDRRIGLRGGALGMMEAGEDGRSYGEVERRLARDLRDNRLERMWSASRVAMQERNRHGLLAELEKRQDTVLVRLDHLNHMLSNGSISMSRYNRFNQELVEYLDSLRNLIARVRIRASESESAVGELPAAPKSLTGATDAEAVTLAVIDSSGIPVVSYGHFTTDESLISGMVSVLDGLNQEMFGSRANMTQLADGEVVYFAQGELSSAFVTFDDEPSPVQITRLREFLDAFEAANEEQLQRHPVDTARIQEVDVPFRFARRWSGTKMAERSP